MGRIEELEEYITDLEEECENLSEQNRLLTIRIQEMEREMKCGGLKVNLTHWMKIPLMKVFMGKIAKIGMMKIMKIRKDVI